MKKLLYILLFLPLFVSAQYESRWVSDNDTIPFRETLNDEFSTRQNGGIPANVTYQYGYGVFNGTSSKIEYAAPAYGVQSIQIDLSLTTTTEDILKLSSTHSIEVGSGTVTATGWSTPTIYVDGSATATATTSSKQIVVTTATGFKADDIKIGTVSGFLEGEVSLINFYNTELSAAQVDSLYKNQRYK